MCSQPRRRGTPVPQGYHRPHVRRRGRLGRFAPGGGACVRRLRSGPRGSHGASAGRPAGGAARAARGPRDRFALLAPGRGLGDGPPRRALRRHHRHREREEPRLQPARPRRPRRGAEAPRALPLSDESARAGPGSGTRRAPGQARPARDLRRRHRERAPLADPQVVEPDPHEPRHAPRRRPPAPRPLGRRPLESPLRRRRRGARLPGRLRLARRQRAAAAAQARPRLRLRAAVPPRLGDDRQPGRARNLADRARLHRHRRRRCTEGREDDRALEPGADRRGARSARKCSSRLLEAHGRPRGARAAHPGLRQEPARCRAGPQVQRGPRRRCVSALSLPSWVHARSATRDRAPPVLRRAARGERDECARARDRRRVVGRGDLGRLPRHRRQSAPAVGTGRPQRARARRDGRERGRPRPVLHAGAGDAARPPGRGRDPRPREPARPRRSRRGRGLRGAARRPRRGHPRRGSPPAGRRAPRAREDGCRLRLGGPRLPRGTVRPALDEPRRLHRRRDGDRLGPRHDRAGARVLHRARGRDLPPPRRELPGARARPRRPQRARRAVLAATTTRRPRRRR